MSWLRAIFGVVVGFFILEMEGWPFNIILNILPRQYTYPAYLLLTGIVIGIISGSSMWGAISGFSLTPINMLLLTVNRSDTTSWFYSFGLEIMIYLTIGGFIGGALTEKLQGEEDYILVRIPK
jgi:hypothetical protein